MSASTAKLKERAEEYLAAIAQKNKDLNIYLEVFEDVKSQVSQVEARLAAGEELPLAGTFLAVKDNILIKGRLASAASKMLANYRASFDATAISRLREAGAVFLGRANMDEFAMGSSTENSAHGPTKNPLAPERVPGGSSGGSAAAVASRLASAALGSDTAGSIRQPASFCGLVGLKPTYGAVSRSGLMALASSLDQIGPLTRTVAEAEQIFKIMAGADPLDSTAYYPPAAERPRPLGKNWIVGVPEQFVSTGLAPAVEKSFRQSLEYLKERGCQIKNITLPSAEHSLPAYYIITPAEASSNLARYDGLRYGHACPGGDLAATYKQTRGEGFGREVKRRILLGTYVLSAGYYDTYYRRALAVRELLKADFRAAFSQVDVIATPTAPTTAFRLGEKVADPLAMYLADVFTVPANLAGVPALSLPFGQDEEGLPVGLQFMAPAYGEDHLFTIGKKFFDHVS
jgi:aspartyl-tRNA(Asn)/glutamyl-tRNA(Gln) amidotransferase subunit A